MSPSKLKTSRLRPVLLFGALFVVWLAPVADASACFVMRYTLKGVHANPADVVCGAQASGAEAASGGTTTQPGQSTTTTAAAGGTPGDPSGAAAASSVTTTQPGQSTTITASAAGAPVITFDSDYPGALHMPAGSGTACYDVPWYITNLYANGAVIYTDTSSASSKPLDSSAEAAYSFSWTPSGTALGAYSYSAGSWTWYTPTSAVVWDPTTAILTGDPTGGQLAGKSAADTYYDPLFCGSTSTSVTVTVTNKATGLSGSLTLTKAIVSP